MYNVLSFVDLLPEKNGGNFEFKTHMCIGRLGYKSGDQKPWRHQERKLCPEKERGSNVV